MTLADAEIYCAGLHHGGAVNGAGSLIDSLPALKAQGELDWASSWHLCLSSRVAMEVKELAAVRELPGVTVTIRDDMPQGAALWRRRAITSAVRMVVRGPEYSRSRGKYEISGFADLTMLQPPPPGVSIAWKDVLRSQVARAVKRRLLDRYDEFVVQTDRMAALLKERYPTRPVTVVKNSPSALLFDREAWRHTPLPGRENDELRLFYPARGYAHKNHVVISSAARILREISGLNLRVVTTLRDSEWAALAPEHREPLINIGEVTVAHLGPLYEACDGVLFPTLNETSSATPLEGMALGRPVFASHRPFVTDTAGDVPFYFDPLDPASIASTIVAALSSPQVLAEHREAGQRLLSELPSAHGRALAYIRVMREASERV